MDFQFDFDAAKPWLVLGGAGMLGRLMYHAKLVQSGKRKPLTWTLVWDVPIALGMGWIALGIATWFNLKWEVTVSLALIIAYLGPYGIDTAFAAYADHFTKKNKDTLNEPQA